MKPAGKITLERRAVGDQPEKRVVEAPTVAESNPASVTSTQGGYVPPHLRNKAPPADVKDAWDDD